MGIVMACPHCNTPFPFAAGLTDEDGKALAAFFAGIEPTLAKSILAYLKLFRPAKTRLTNARALKIAREVHAMIISGEVSRDHQKHRTTVNDWLDAMATMDAAPPRKLPLDSHGYLCEVVVSVVLSRADAGAVPQAKPETKVDRWSQAAEDFANGR